MTASKKHTRAAESGRLTEEYLLRRFLGHEGWKRLGEIVPHPAWYGQMAVTLVERADLEMTNLPGDPRFPLMQHTKPGPRCYRLTPKGRLRALRAAEAESVTP